MSSPTDRRTPVPEMMSRRDQVRRAMSQPIGAIIDILPPCGLPDVRPGDDLAELITRCCRPEAGDIFAIAHKMVSKADGRIRKLREVKPSARAMVLASEVEWGSWLAQIKVKALLEHDIDVNKFASHHAAGVRGQELCQENSPRLGAGGMRASGTNADPIKDSREGHDTC
ncbi:MAG: coenzyme F420-0:L-glutamate ligase [Candidatus Acidiferrales bacterium]